MEVLSAGSDFCPKVISDFYFAFTLNLLIKICDFRKARRHSLFILAGILHLQGLLVQV